MIRCPLALIVLLITWSGCDAADATLDTVYVAPEAEVEIPYTLDLDSDGTYDLALTTTFFCSQDDPTSSCMTSLLGRPGDAASLLTVRDSTVTSDLTPGTEVGPYPDLRGFPSGVIEFPHWGQFGGASLAAIHYDVIEGTSRVISENTEVYYGLRVGNGDEARYGWVLLSGRVASGERGLYPVAIVHAYALGAPGEVVRVAERP